MCRDKNFYVATNNSTNDKDKRRKFYRNKRKTLSRQSRQAEEKNACHEKKIMSRQFPDAEVYKELDATNFVSRHKAFLSRQEQD